MNISIANQLFDQGIFTDLYKAGFITAKVFTYREIYLWVQAQMQTRGLTKNQAVLEAEVEFNKDERTIWRALNSFSHTPAPSKGERVSQKVLSFGEYLGEVS